MKKSAFLSAQLVDLRMVQEKVELVASTNLAPLDSNTKISSRGKLTASYGFANVPEGSSQYLFVEASWDGETRTVVSEQPLATYSSRFRAVFQVTDYVGFDWPQVPQEAANPYISFVQDALHRRVEHTLSFLGLPGQVLKRSNLTNTKDTPPPTTRRGTKKGKSKKVAKLA